MDPQGDLRCVRVGSVSEGDYGSIKALLEKCSGDPVDVDKYQGIDGDAVYDACGRVLAATAVENLRISSSLLAEPAASSDVSAEQLWPPRS